MRDTHYHYRFFIGGINPFVPDKVRTREEWLEIMAIWDMLDKKTTNPKTDLFSQRSLWTKVNQKFWGFPPNCIFSTLPLPLVSMRVRFDPAYFLIRV